MSTLISNHCLICKIISVTAHYIDGRPVSDTIKNTAETVSFFDDLFDSVNGTVTSLKKAKGKTLRTAVRQTSGHHSFWREAIKRLQNTTFIDKNLKEKTVPTLQNFITTLKSYIHLWTVFQNKNVKIMRPRYFNTDPIENYFGQVRAYNYRNNDPTCTNFMNTFKSLLITRIINFHSLSYNCEDDVAEHMIDLSQLFNENESDSNTQTVLPSEDPAPLPSPSIPGDRHVQRVLEQARRERLNVHSRAYTAGWVIKKYI